MSGIYIPGMDMPTGNPEEPTADVRPNVPGKWLKYAISCNDGLSHVFGFKCSACGGFCIGESNFCPNCGAYMRPEEDENSMEWKMRNCCCCEEAGG